VWQEAAAIVGRFPAATVIPAAVSGSHTWGEWIGGSIVAAMAIPLAAFTTSKAYERLVSSDFRPEQFAASMFHGMVCSNEFLPML
jgi:hypothetical protein